MASDRSFAVFDGDDVHIICGSHVDLDDGPALPFRDDRKVKNGAVRRQLDVVKNIGGVVADGKFFRNLPFGEKHFVGADLF